MAVTGTVEMMSRNNSIPVPIELLVFLGVAVGAGVIASELLGYLSNTTAAPDGLGWWVPLLSIGMPVLAIVAVIIWIYLGSGR